MKLKITQSGWEGYTGWFGRVEFVDGLSVSEVTPNMANSLGGIIEIKEVDENNEEVGVINPSVYYLVNKDVGAEIYQNTESVNSNDLEKENIEARLKAFIEENKREKFHTKEELEAILSADEGVKNLRAIGYTWGVKDRVARILLDKILASQETFKRNYDLAIEKIKSGESFDNTFILASTSADFIKDLDED